MNDIEIRQQVLDLLQRFKGMEPLKELFWSHLNYDRVKSQNVTRRKWPEPAASALAEDPSLLAEGGKDGDFKVVYSRLVKDRLSLADERIVISRLLKDHPYGLFVFSDRTQTNWHFVNVKMAEDEDKRKLYRRVTVGPNEKMRTACQVISQLDLSSIESNLFGLSALAIQERHDQSFDVEPVTEAFYEQYKLVFEKVEDLIRGIRDKDRKRLFTQRLFNRLMFIAFIQKKGWLQFGGNKNQDYLNALWADYRKNGNREMGFYHERLYQLFFHGLGAQVDYDLMKINKGGLLREVIGKVPYLNGGLFEEDDDDKDGSIKVPDEAIRAVLADLFDHFNFTVTEATPLDVEVAVDPEMLGKVFEELVTGRHESGSYYTPKPIVSFMCREALKGYLEANLPKEKLDIIARFVDDHDPSGLRDAEVVLEALRRVRVCDPACGSGAYLLGMLHELMDLRTCLFSAKRIDPVSAYDRKLDIIQRNVYGVDLDPFAVNIARLRLWLSLAVEFDGEAPEPLPNLKFEIEEGDSVSAPGPQPTQGLMRETVVRQFAQTKALYIKSHGDRKRKLEEEILDLKRSIASWTHGQGAVVKGLDWPIEFAEVFDEGGFDIVIANPPYVRHELIVGLKPTLKAIFPEVYSGVADLYVYFYARALQILKSGGMLTFISSNKWFRSGYGEKLRSRVSESCRIVSITDFGDLPVFKSATAYPMIFISQKLSGANRSTRVTEVADLKPPYPDVLAIVHSKGYDVPSSAFNGAHWNLGKAAETALLEKMKTSGLTLGEYTTGRIFYGVKTGCNAAFMIDGDRREELVKKEKKSADIIKPMAQGRDIRKWVIAQRDVWLIFARRGIDIDKYPAIKAHLQKFRQELEPRPRNWPSSKKWEGRKPGSYKWYEIQDEVAYFREFNEPKIVYQEIATFQSFAFDSKGLFVNNKAFIIPGADLFLLAVLNSTPAWFFLQNICSKLQGGALAMQSPYLGQLPIPNATPSQRAKLVSLAEKCIESGGDGCEKWESSINELVASLYGVDVSECGTYAVAGK